MKTVSLNLSALDASPVLPASDDDIATLKMSINGNVWVSIDHDSNSVPADEYHGRVRTWQLPDRVDSQALRALLLQPATQKLLQKVLRGWTIEFDGQNMVGVLAKPSWDAEDALQEQLDELGGADISLWDAEEFFSVVGIDELWPAEKTLAEALTDAKHTALVDQSACFKDPQKLGELFVKRLREAVERGELDEEELSPEQRAVLRE